MASVQVTESVIREKRVTISRSQLVDAHDEQVDFLTVEIYWTDEDTGRVRSRSVKIPAR